MFVALFVAGSIGGLASEASAKQYHGQGTAIVFIEVPMQGYGGSMVVDAGSGEIYYEATVTDAGHTYQPKYVVFWGFKNYMPMGSKITWNYDYPAAGGAGHWHVVIIGTVNMQMIGNTMYEVVTYDSYATLEP
jgi:hypothetical protein